MVTENTQDTSTHQNMVHKIHKLSCHCALILYINKCHTNIIVIFIRLN